MTDFNSIFTYSNGQLFNAEGEAVGSTNKQGYVTVYANKKQHQAHRVIWEMHNGAIPEGMQIDHINRNPSDNRLSNLRLATPQQNMYNRVRAEENRSADGLPRGVRKHMGGYLAYANYNGQEMWAGLYDDVEDAKFAAIDLRLELYGEFATYY